MCTKLGMLQTPGWFAGTGVVPSPEETRDRMDQIRDPKDYWIPLSVTDELKAFLELFQA